MYTFKNGANYNLNKVNNGVNYTILEGTRWNKLHNALLFSFMWHKLPKLIFRCGANYIERMPY